MKRLVICGIIILGYLYPERYYKSRFMDITYEIIHKKAQKGKELCKWGNEIFQKKI